MYRIIQPDGKVFLQMELTDYFDPQLKQTFLYKTWLKKGFIAAIRGYYLQSASTHKEHRQQHLAAFPANTIRSFTHSFYPHFYNYQL